MGLTSGRDHNWPGFIGPGNPETHGIPSPIQCGRFPAVQRTTLYTLVVRAVSQEGWFTRSAEWIAVQECLYGETTSCCQGVRSGLEKVCDRGTRVGLLGEPGAVMDGRCGEA